MENLQEKFELEYREKGAMGLIKSQKWALGVFFFLITPLMIHTAALIIKVSGFDFENDMFKFIYGGFFAIGFDLAILTFAVNGRKRDAGAMAFFVFLFNLSFLNYDFFTGLGSYQLVDQVVDQVVDQELVNGVTTGDPDVLNSYPYSRIIITLIVSALGAWIIHSYVGFFVDKSDDKKRLFKLFSENETFKKSNEKLTSGFASLKSAKEKKEVEMEESIGKIQGQLSEKTNSLTHTKSLNTELKTKLEALEGDNRKLLTENARLKATPVNGHSNGVTVPPKEEKAIFSNCTFCERDFTSQQQENAVRGKCEACKSRKLEESTSGSSNN